MALRFAVRHVAAALLVAGTLFFSAPAFADTITLGSGMANTTVTYNNSAANAPQNTGMPLTGTASTVSLGYAAPITGTSYITYTSSGSANGGVTVYTTTFTGNFSGGLGSLWLAADDSVTAFLNGVQIGSTGAASYNTIVGPLAFTGGVNGLNTLTFYVNNVNSPVYSLNATAGPTNFDFKVALATAPTPEPSSLALLGTGILGVAGVMRKKFRS